MAFEQGALINPKAVRAKRFQNFAFSFARCLACFVQDTDRSVSTLGRDNNDRVARKKRCLRMPCPIDRQGLEQLIANGKATHRSSRP